MVRQNGPWYPCWSSRSWSLGLSVRTERQPMPFLVTTTRSKLAISVLIGCDIAMSSSVTRDPFAKSYVTRELIAITDPINYEIAKVS